ncbi:MAG: family 20 glycosylhydrolase [Bacteroidales bacterium]|nr:family 20 glycosylhydrolase [Bacteroidales bacterium]
MKGIRILIIISLSLQFFCIVLPVSGQNSKHNIIPLPQSYEKGKGYFVITPRSQIIISPSSKELSKLSDLLKERLRLLVVQESNGLKSTLGYSNTIKLELTDSPELGKEGYKLVVEKKTLTLSANTGNGIFYAMQTLFQMLPAEIEDRNPSLSFEEWRVPVCRIVDYPRFEYRGMHLDVCRHFFPVEFIKKYIDLMSMYKINNFHWHLTDDQGWRLEIKKYPLLTEIGSMRSGTPVGRNIRTDEKPYGGFYTQDDAREIVKYASARYVNVIPEIEMPGHALAALSSYPQFSCTGGPFEVWTKWGVTDDIFCAGKDETFAFIEDVLTEVLEIFPSRYIHVGGDEAPKTRWDSCLHCQKRISELGLRDANELQSYFIRRIEKFLNRNGRQIIGWDEILEGGLAPGATVMSWRGTEGGVTAAQLGHAVIMTPGTPCYFDHFQGNPANEPLAFGGYNPLKRVYDYEPIPAGLKAGESEFILGSQGNVWSEYISTGDHVEYMAYPRAVALAEVNWSDRKKRNWDDFIERFGKHISRLEKRDVNFSRSTYIVSMAVERDSTSGNMKVLLESDIPGGKIVYCTDDQNGNGQYRKYKGPFSIYETKTISAYLTIDGQRPGNISSRTIYVHDAFGKIPSLNSMYSGKYSASGPVTLTDGCRAHPSSLRSDWLGYHGHDAELVIDLGKETEIRNVNIGFLHNPANWIFLPTGVEISLSSDGANYIPAEGIQPELLTIREPITIDFNQIQINTKARYIKVIAKNRGTCPPGHQGAGGKAWLFIDEVMVNQPVD